jgi:3',5'-cyclic AMP phosphodiesterase CpdA
MQQVNSSADTIPQTLPSSTPRLSENARVLHLTDLHCGRGFQEDLWKHLEAIVRQRKPHAILVTGDLVNNPYWWTLRKALALLEALERAATAADGKKPTIYVIPGNHDTRLTGLIPIGWISPIVAALYIVISVIGYFHHSPSAWLWTAPVALILLAYRYCCLRKFSNFFSGYIPELPTALNDLNLVLYPFDSATSPISGAGGYIPLSQFVSARSNVGSTTVVPFRLAIVHHHSVPIPYDSQSEALMVLKNAGAFLSEIAACGVRLVLSGHKHHQHVSRVTINAETDHERELTVLNTGSPTAGKYPGQYGHNFSFLEIHPQCGAHVTQYKSVGGAFNALPSFWVDSVEKCAKVLLRENKELRHFHYEALEVDVSINEDGDAFRIHRVCGFTYSGDEEIRASPVSWRAKVGTGQIERPVVRPDAGSPVETELVWNERSRQQVDGRIIFSRPVMRGHKPFGFAVESHAVNSYAMSAQQFALLHPKRKTAAVEFVQMDLNRAPVGLLVIRVELPANFKIKGRPELLVLRGDNVEQRLQDAYADSLNFDQDRNIINLRISSPPLGVGYRVAWSLTDEPPPAGRTFQHLDGEAVIIANCLQQLANRDPKSNPLSLRLLPAIAEEARREFGLATEELDPLSLSIMVFDRALGKLRIAAGNYKADDDPRWGVQLSYGDGIAGRALKMNTTRLFIKAKAQQNGLPFYYADGTDKAPTDTGDEIREEALISLPLSHPDESHATFGIINISSDRQDSRLVNLTSDHETTQFRLAVSKACFEATKELC